MSNEWPKNFTPREIVRELDRHIVGQDDAKKAVAIALRNRWRRQQVAGELRDEIVPNNIIMIGTTGVGKTEIARRISRLVGAPFAKVEATNYTEVGYMGRDVESIIRDLVETAIAMVRTRHQARVQTRAVVLAEDRLLDLLMPTAQVAVDDDTVERRRRTREKLRDRLRAGELENRTVMVAVPSRGGMPLIEIFSKTGAEDFNFTLPGMAQNTPFGSGPGTANREREMKVSEARGVLRDDEASKLLDMEKVVEEARELAQSNGIVFIDEIDKIAARTASAHGPDVSREGVQRDLLPIVEGTTVNTRHGPVSTDHILFIAAGAFNVSKPSDLIPEFQGRFPIRVELQSLGRADFERILREPDCSLVRQYTAIVAADRCELVFEDDAISEIARVAAEANERTENISARRLQTVMTTLLEDVLFDLPESGTRRVVFSAADVRSRLDGILANDDLTRYIL